MILIFHDEVSCSENDRSFSSFKYESDFCVIILSFPDQSVKERGSWKCFEISVNYRVPAMTLS